MSWEIGKGQKVFREIVDAIAPGAVVNIDEAVQGRYPVMILTPTKKPIMLHIPEEDFDDLGQNGGRRADITMRIEQALNDADPKQPKPQ